MTKPLMLWCAKTPRGVLIPLTVRLLKRQVVELFYGNYEGQRKNGYTVVRVSVEEVE